MFVIQMGYLCDSPLRGSDSSAGHGSSTHSVAICQEYISGMEKRQREDFSGFWWPTFLTAFHVMLKYKQFF